MEILVTIPATPAQRARLEAALPGAHFTYCRGEQLTGALLAEAEIILGNIPPERIGEARALRWLQLNSAGSDAYAKAVPPDVLLTNASGAYGLAISEWMLAASFLLKSKLYLYRRNQQQCLWRDEGEVSSLWGSTALVIGLGDIGGTFARKLRALGGHVIGIRRHRTALPDYLDAQGTLDELDEFLPQADIVSLSLPNSPETRRVMDARRLAQMKPGSILLNVGRGSAVDTDALVAALQTGPMLGAALDVTDPEPLPPEHPLWKAENCVITPHIAGDFHLPETLERIVGIMARNLANYAAGRPLENQVDRASGYRAFSEQ